MEERRDGIAGSTREALDWAGHASETAGRVLAEKAAAFGQKRKGLRSAKNAGEKLIDVAADSAIDLVHLLGRSIDGLGSATRRASPTVGAATGGMIVGTIGTVSGAVDSFALTQADFDAIEQRLLRAGARAREQAHDELKRINLARLLHRRDTLLDLLVIGGVSLADILRHPDNVPSEVQQAFALAYPGLTAAGETFAHTVSRVPTEDLIGLVNSVKGKLFEMELVDQLNGSLTDGLHAELANSATQPGYDILVRDAHGDIVHEIQAKATESASYVKEALERYPNIDITTTSEVHGHLMALGLSAEHVTDSGIAEAALQQKVETAAGIGQHVGASDFVPSALGLALIAFSAFSKTRVSWEERGVIFGERAAKATIAGAAAKSLLLATNTWWIALPAGVGLRVMAGRGDAKRQRYNALKGIVESLEASNIARPAAPKLLPRPA
ncbi:hypothetical protein [Novosphingobium sp. G106]|uniref:hypothetical protein n=1 Tax=Novosphingobium sp. G106 TaxID=2849500 RepID=UPI0020C2C35A|nr:hypothetical protein [Novosphingobium sp. G106]